MTSQPSGRRHYGSQQGPAHMAGRGASQHPPKPKLHPVRRAWLRLQGKAL